MIEIDATNRICYHMLVTCRTTHTLHQSIYPSIHTFASSMLMFHTVTCVYLWHWEAELRQLQVPHQWHGHPVRQHQVAAHDVLDQVVREATERG